MDHQEQHPFAVLPLEEPHPEERPARQIERPPGLRRQVLPEAPLAPVRRVLHGEVELGRVRRRQHSLDRFVFASSRHCGEDRAESRVARDEEG